MKKIMFNDHYGLTEAVLSGRKTQTRRIVAKSTLDEVDKFMVDYYNATFDRLTEIEALRHYFFVEKIGKLPFKVGEIVAVAQAYNDFYNDECDPRIFPDGAGWTNKMFVRADLMPHHIRITNVRVEWLQDISDEDCMEEGVVECFLCVGPGNCYLMSKCSKCGCHNRKHSPREAYAALIDKISGKGTWSSNPFVFVYDFELVDKSCL